VVHSSALAVHAHPEGPEGSGVALAGSNPNCDANCPKSGNGRPLRPSFGNCPGALGLVAVGLVMLGLGAIGPDEDNPGAVCGKAMATVERKRVTNTPFILYDMDPRQRR
jgi:hypothetical protein